MASIPFMPLYVSDYLADTPHLSTLEHGAYISLMMTSFMSRRPLRPGDKQMARVARVTLEEWSAIKGNILPLLMETEDGYIHEAAVAERHRVESTTRPPFGEWRRLRKLVFRRDGDVCTYCGDEDGPFEIDHVIPISRGGGNELANLTVACRFCNRSKRDQTVEEWIGRVA